MSERSGKPLIEAEHLSKRFGRVTALTDVSFTVKEGEVLALLGDNGAGKSTVIKLLNGLFPPDKGAIKWEGETVRFSSPKEAYQRGVATVYQDLAVIELMSIYRNMFLGREDLVTKGFGPVKWLDRARARRETTEALEAIGISIRSPDEPVAGLSGGERQSIAIARGIHFSARLLILDEPTSALSLKQTSQVLSTIEKASERGLAVIFISHNVHHVHPVADRYVILSHGESIAEFGRDERSRDEVSELIMYGRDALEGEPNLLEG